MRLDRYISKNRIIDLVSRDLEGALKELLEVCDSGKEDFDEKELLEDLLDREKTMTTYLGSGIALPHLRIPMKRAYLFAIGRCPDGLEFEGHGEYKDLRLIFLLLASDKEKSYLNVLASLARTFQEPAVVERLIDSPDLATLRSNVATAFGRPKDPQKSKDNKFNRLILREAVKIATGAKCSSVMVFGDTFAGGVDIADDFGDFKTLLVTQSASEMTQAKRAFNAIIPVRSFGNNRLSQLRSAMLIGLTRGLIKSNERMCCVGGIQQSNQFDTLVVVDVEREFQSVFTRQSDMLPASVKPEVLERVLGIATELSVEGREGKPIGTLFVIGEAAKIKPYVKQLVLNPFHGYEREERNILNPFMDETVKEFSFIDGAFIINGDGVLEAAGSMIHAPDYIHELPSGLGTRHAAANAISIASDCIALVVSASSGQVTLFRRGQMLPLIERSQSNNV